MTTRLATGTVAVQTNQNERGAFRFKHLLSSTAIVLGMVIVPVQAALAVDDLATPTGEQVVGGSASFNRPTDGLLNITQNTDRVVINWDSFNIGGNATTEFFQPGSSSLAVNRVTSKGSDPTQILGTLKANGQVMVLDRNGVIFGKNSTIDVGGIVASTGDVDNDAVMRGDRTLELSNFGDGAIVNNGLISVADEGLAAFVAPTVVNNGIINAKLGKVALSTGGERATVDLYGDGLVEIALDSQKTNALIKNTGEINAEGGTVALTASAAKEAVDDVINMSGVVKVSSAQVVGGKIVLSGGKSGTVTVSGNLDASGKNGGGKINVTGQNVNVANTAHLNADAVTNGNGGSVDIVAQDHADFRGQVYARGGSESGNGGAAEISGLGTLGFDGLVDLSAAYGARGTLLLDPTFAVIHDGPGTAADPLGAGETISAQALANTMAATNINITATNYIDVGTKLTGYTGANSAALNALSDGDINLSLTSGAVTTAGNLTLQSSKVNFNRNLTMGTGNVDVVAPSVTLTGRLYAANGTTELGDARLSSNATNVSVASTARIQQGIELAGAGAVVNVDAGSYAENVSINKSVNLKGANAGVAGTGVRGAESIITNPSATGTSTVTVTGNDVTINGFNIVGDGATTADDAAIEAFNANNLTIRDNLITDGSFGIYAWGGTSDKGLIKDNYVRGADAQAIHTRDNQYFDITNNKIDTSAVGITTENFSTARADGLVTNITGNDISASKIGIRNNLSYGTQTGFKFAGNTITAENAAEARRWSGVEVLSQQGGTASLFQNNDINGSAVDATRQTTGYEITNVTNTGTVINGGTISNVDTGIWATDGSFYTGAVSDLLIKGVTFVATGKNDILVEDTSDATNDPAINVNNTGTTVTIGAGNSFSGGAVHNVTLVGSKAKALLDAGFNGVSTVLVKAASAVTNYTAAPLGTAITLSADNASIQAGINVAKTNGTVDVEAGTFAENVALNKGVKLQGANVGVAGTAVRGAETVLTNPSGTGVSIITATANNATIDGFKFVGDGATTSDDAAIESSNADNLKIQNNLITDASFGIYASGGNSTTGVIRNNYVQGADQHAIHTRDNQYFDILNNNIDTSSVGITTENFSTARADGLVTRIDGNVISASKIGIRNNLSYGTQTGFKISNNTITAENPAEARRWTGVDVLSQQGGVATLFKNNDIDGSGAGARSANGYEVTNMSNPSAAVIDGGTVQNVDAGVWATDGSFYTGAVNDLLVKNVNFNNNDSDILVEDVSDAALAAGVGVNGTGTTVTVGAGNNFSGGAVHNVTLVGSQAKALLDAGFAGVNSVLVKAANAVTHYVPNAPNTNTFNADNASIQAGIAVAKTGGKVDVEAGTFAENVDLNKGVNLRGANAGVAGNGVRGAETVLTNPSGTGVSIITATANDATIDGFKFVGDGATTADDAAIESSNADNLTIKNNLITDASFGIYAWGGNSTTGEITRNYVRGADVQAIHTRDNQYFDITNNKIRSSAVGITTENFSVARADGQVTLIDGNDIRARNVGIRNNLSYGTQTGFQISNNTIKASGPAATRRWSGVEVISQQDGVATLFQNNTINGNGAGARQTTGYELTNIISPNQAVIDGGTISNVDTGVWATDGSFYTGAVNDVLIKNVNFATDKQDILVEDTSDVNNDPAINVNNTGTTVTIGAGNTFTGGAIYNLTLVGSKAKALLDAGFNGVNTVLVKAASVVTNYVDAPYGTTTTLSADNASIQAGIDAASGTGGIVDVQAGTFAENVNLNKGVNLRGANTGVAGNGVRGAETVLTNPSGTGVSIITATGGTGATIDGFKFVGDGATTADDAAIESSNANNLTIKNNLITDASFGIYAWGGTATQGKIQTNYVRGADQQAIHTRDNQYFNIANNKIDTSAIGITTENFSAARPDGLITHIIGNDISVSKIGIRNNLSYGTQTGFKVSNNTITAENAAETRRWTGIEVLSQQDGVASIFRNNTIDGSAVDATRQTTGYELTNIISPNQALIDGGSVSGVDTGVWATDGSFYTGAVNDVLIKNVTFNTNQNDILVEDTSDVNNDPAINVNNTGTTVTIGAGNTFTGGAVHNLTLVGSKAKALLDAGFNGVDTVLVKAASAVTNYTANPYGTTTTLSADNASIQAGIDAASGTGGIVDVQAGTFAENVNLNKGVNLRGANTGVAGTGVRGAETVLTNPSGTGVSIITATGGTGAIIDGFKFVGDGAVSPEDAAIESFNADNLTIKNNLITDASFGIYAWGGNSTTGKIQDNYVRGADLQGIHTRDNQYFDISNNTIDTSAIGITTENFSAARADGLLTHIIGNTISASKIGIRNNLSYGNQTGFKISTNTITAENPGAAGRWTGIDVISQMDGVGSIFKNNTIDGSAVDATRQTSGYELTNMVNANRATIDGGSVSGVDTGVWATDGSFYTGAVNDLLIKNVAFNTNQNDILVEDTSDANNDPAINVNNTGTTVTIGAGNTFTGGAVHNLTLVGSKAKALLDTGFDGVATVLVKAASPVTNYTDSPYGTTTTLSADNASIQAGVSAAGTGGQVDVEAGNYTEGGITINKSVNLLSLAGRDNTTINGVAGVDTITVNGASNVQIGDTNGLTDNGFSLVGGRNGIVINGTTDTNVNGNKISDVTENALQISASDNIVVSNNLISNSGAAGLFLSGGDNGSVVLRANKIDSAAGKTGAVFESGTIDLTGLGTLANTFTGGDIGMRFVTFNNSNPLALVDNTIGETVFNLQTGNYIELANGAFFAPGNPSVIDASHVTFDGFRPDSVPFLTTAQYDFLESKIFHYNDDPTLGLFFFGSVPDISQEDIFDAFNGFDAAGRGLSITIRGLPRLPGQAGGGAGAFNLANISPAAGGPESVANIEPAAGGDDNGASVANIEPAAGGGDAEQTSCWSDAAAGAAGGATVTLNFGDGAESDLTAAAGCQSGGL